MIYDSVAEEGTSDCFLTELSCCTLVLTMELHSWMGAQGPSEMNFNRNFAINFHQFILLVRSFGRAVKCTCWEEMHQSRVFTMWVTQEFRRPFCRTEAQSLSVFSSALLSQHISAQNCWHLLSGARKPWDQPWWHVRWELYSLHWWKKWKIHVLFLSG